MNLKNKGVIIAKMPRITRKKALTLKNSFMFLICKEGISLKSVVVMLERSLDVFWGYSIMFLIYFIFLISNNKIDNI
jgi:hypothetical protein